MGTWEGVGVILLASLNLIASVTVLRSKSLSRAQRWLQLLIIWLLPVVGAILILGFLMTDRSRRWEGSGAGAESAGDITVLDQGPNPCGCSGVGAESD